MIRFDSLKSDVIGPEVLESNKAIPDATKPDVLNFTIAIPDVVMLDMLNSNIANLDPVEVDIIKLIPVPKTMISDGVLITLL